MFVTILVCMGIGALVLLFLYLIARWVPILGDALAFICVLVARIFVKLQGMLEKAGAYCNNVFEKTLNYPPNVASDTWHGVLVIARNIILAVSSIVITGDIENMLLSVPLLFGGGGSAPPPSSGSDTSPGNSSSVSLPGIFSIPTSLLFVAMSMLFGAILLECIESIPYGAGLFPKMTDKVRKLLIVISSIGVVLSLVFAVVFWVYRGWYLVDPESAGVLAIPVFALAGLLVIGSSVFSLWGLVVGLVGLSSVVFWLLSTAFHLSASCVSLVPSLLDVVALHYTQGTMSVYGDFLGHDPYKAPRSPFPASRLSLPGQRATVLLSQNASTVVDADVEHIVPVETTIQEVPMNLDKNASFSFLGGFGAQMFPLVSQDIYEDRATHNTKSSAFIVLPINHMDTSLPGVADMTPRFAKRYAVALQSATQAEAYKKLFDDLADTLIEVHGDLKAVPAALIFFIDCHELIEAVDMLESIKRRYPLCRIVVLTEVSSLDLQDKIVQVGLSDMQAVVAEDIVETIMLSDPHSAFAHEYGLETQHRFLAKLIVSLVIAATHSTTNIAFPDVLHALHSSSALTVINATSKAVAVGKMPKRFFLLPGVKGRVGTGSLPDILAQSRGAIDEVVTKEETAMYPVTGSPGVFRVVVVNVPVKLSDERFLVCCRENALYVSTNHPHTLCLTVRGNGCAYPHHIGSRFLVQASCLTPIHNPTSLLRSQGGKQVNVTPLYPTTTALEPTSGNGLVPTLPQKAQTKTTKATRQQKAAPARRVGRKNTKMAK